MDVRPEVVRRSFTSGALRASPLAIARRDGYIARAAHKAAESFYTDAESCPSFSGKRMYSTGADPSELSWSVILMLAQRAEGSCSQALWREPAWRASGGR